MHVTVSQYEANLWSTQVNNIWQAKPISSRCPVLWQAGFQKSQNLLDCLQSAFSLKIRLVLTSSSTIANHDIYRGFAACVLRFHVKVCLHAFSYLPSPLFHFFGSHSISCAAKTENLPNRNTCSGRLLRRRLLHVCTWAAGAANESTLW